MSNPWFRLYAELLTDPKIQRMSEADQRRYILLLCIRCSNGDVTLHDDDVAFQLRISNDEWLVTKALFVSKNLIDEDNKPIAWDRRQFISDSSYERVKRHRQKRVDIGLPQQNFIPKTTRAKVFERDGGACVYCGSTDDLTIDHNQPQSRGGSDEIENLLTACRACNAAKRDLTHDEYLDRNGLVTLPKRPHIQKQIQITDTDKNKNKPPVVDLFVGVSAQVVSDFKATRNKLKAPITKTAIAGIQREADKAGISLESALTHCIERNWRGFKAEWLDRPTSTIISWQDKKQAADDATNKAMRDFANAGRVERLVVGEVV